MVDPSLRDEKSRVIDSFFRGVCVISLNGVIMITTDLNLREILL